MKTNINKKQIVINLIIIVMVTGLTIFSLCRNKIVCQIDQITRLPWYGILIILGLIFISIVFDVFVIFNSFRSINKNMKYSDCLGVYLYGNLGSSITPYKSGHFPFMFYYYKRKGIEMDEALNAITQNQIVYSTVLILVYSVLAIICYVNQAVLVVQNTSIPLVYVSLIGIFINLSFLGIVLSMAFCKPINNFIVKIVAFILFKFKKIQSKEIYFKEEKIKMLRYKEQTKYLITHFYKAFFSVISYSLFILSYAGIPYCIYLFMTHSTFNIQTYFLFFSLNQAMSYFSNIIPLPGGAGTSEYAFLIIFDRFFPSDLIGTSMILWRFATYYFFVLLDFIYFLISMKYMKKISDKKTHTFEKV